MLFSKTINSRRGRAVVQDDPAFTARLVEAMLHDGPIEKAEGKSAVYRKKR